MWTTSLQKQVCQQRRYSVRFEKLAREHKTIQRIRWNLDDAAMPEDLDVRGIGIEGDLACVIPQL